MLEGNDGIAESGLLESMSVGIHCYLIVTECYYWLRSNLDQDVNKSLTVKEAGVKMTFNQTSVPENIADLFPRTEEFGYELMNLRLQLVCDTMQERDSIYTREKEVHLYVAMLGPRRTKDKNWYGIYW